MNNNQQEKTPFEKNMDRFKHEFINAVKIFLTLSKRYQNDDDKVLRLIPIYKDFIEEINKKYNKIRLVLEDRDLTKDDLKILLPGYTSSQKIKNEIGIEPSFTTKYNPKYKCLQAYIMYDYLDYKENPELHSIAAFTLLEKPKDMIIKIPNVLEHIYSDFSESYGSNDHNLAGRQ